MQGKNTAAFCREVDILYIVYRGMIFSQLTIRKFISPYANLSIYRPALMCIHYKMDSCTFNPLAVAFSLVERLK